MFTFIEGFDERSPSKMKVFNLYFALAQLCLHFSQRTLYPLRCFNYIQSNISLISTFRDVRFVQYANSLLRKQFKQQF